MLAPAHLYEEDLIDKFRQTWFKDKYIFYYNGCYFSDFGLYEDTCNIHQFASINYGEVIGYIGYTIDRATNVAYDLNIINFTDDSVVFGIDLVQAIDDIFNKFNLDKVEFTVLIGNPAEDMYDKFIRIYGGRIVGTYKKHVKLADGKIYDLKMYELFKTNYNKRKVTVR